uniref:Phytocyanin domain-containing protein n=1 Tax=Fagus sylvatica TaxID=28930 RepID=A0A2N9FMV4_FAGSY
MMSIFCAECRDPVLHRVGGGRYTWAPNINFKEWSSHEQFFVGDWLYFGFDKRLYNVLEVNKTSHDNCIDKDFIKNITRGGRDVFNLTEAKPYYFLSGRGYCFKGMKVAMLVLEYHSPPAVPPEVPNPASDICSKMIQLVLLGTALVCTLLFKYI